MLSSCAPPAQTNPGAAVVTRYIKAVQNGDRKTIIDLSNFNQEDINQIKANNPQVLWAKLLKEYYDAHSTGALDPQAQAVQGLVLPSSKWEISETRAGRGQDSVLSDPYNRVQVYVTVDYSTLNDSPLVDGGIVGFPITGAKFLKKVGSHAS
jgi:hypothetical protein